MLATNQAEPSWKATRTNRLGLPDGQGLYETARGDFFVGELKNGLPEGQGNNIVLYYFYFIMPIIENIEKQNQGWALAVFFGFKKSLFFIIYSL